MNIAVTTLVLPESVADATVVTWHKQPGEHVIQDESLVDLETDKAIFDLPAPQSGVLKEILQPEGSVVTANTPLAEILPGKALKNKKTTPKKPQADIKAETEDTALSLPPHASQSVRQQLHAVYEEESPLEAQLEAECKKIEKEVNISVVLGFLFGIGFFYGGSPWLGIASIVLGFVIGSIIKNKNKATYDLRNQLFRERIQRNSQRLREEKNDQ